MDIIYVSTSCPMNDIDNINCHLKKKMQVSSNKYHNALIDGLSKNCDNIYSIYSLPVNNKNSKKIFWSGKSKKNSNCTYYQLSFLNLPIIKYISLNISLNKIIKKIIRSTNIKDLRLIIDGSFISVFPVLNKYCKKISCFAIIADVYEYMAKVNNKSKFNKFVVNIVRNYVGSVYKKLCGFIFLNENMNELFNSDNYIVIEGVNYHDFKLSNFKENNNITLLYAGGLLEKFGILNLINSFKLIDNKKLMLHLYGYTDIEDKILELISDDKRIKYFGMKDVNTVFDAEKRATILINPRPLFYEFQKYSFPSKIIEYMSAGRPIITTKIDGMPKEYNDYLFYFDDYSVDGLKNKIEEVIDIPLAELNEIGVKSHNFVSTSKSSYNQAKKIKEFIE